MEKLFPSWSLENWQKTKETLHLYLQVAGKIKMALMPEKNHLWHSALFVSVRGISTNPIPYKDFLLNIEFDFIEHQLKICTSRGQKRTFDLHEGLSVAEFYNLVMDNLASLEIEVSIVPKPFDHISQVPFAVNFDFHSYNRDHISGFFNILIQANNVFEEFAGRFCGKSSPVQIYWRHFDLSLSRYSGKKAPEMDWRTKAEESAFSHEMISFGLCPGDQIYPQPVFYSYIFPTPEGLTEEPLYPASARWVDKYQFPVAILPYSALEEVQEQKQLVLDFLESAYLAGATRANWEIEQFNLNNIHTFTS